MRESKQPEKGTIGMVPFVSSPVLSLSLLHGAFEYVFFATSSRGDCSANTARGEMITPFSTENSLFIPLHMVTKSSITVLGIFQH